MTQTQVHTRAVIATTAEKNRRGTLVVTEFCSRDRLKRAAAAAANCLGITALCIFIPGAHFILVPLGLLVVTPIVATRIFRAQTRIDSSNIECPKCEAPVAVLTTKEVYPMYETCPSCHRQIVIRRDS
jgi:hypothetical protein